jgi:hypothetical protein
MTEATKDKSKIAFPIESSLELPEKELKARFLNVFLRNFSVLYKGKICQSLKDDDLKLLSSMTNISRPTVQVNVEEFLCNLINLEKFFHDYKMKWPHEPAKLYRKARIQLHRIYRFAPVFNYDRARKNLEILHSVLKKKLFWPQINTQIAIVIYVTDINDKSFHDNERLLQKNIRALCNCSAYAFHRTRNILNIN